MIEVRSLVFIIFVLLVIAVISAVWFGCVLLKELDTIKSNSRDVSKVFTSISVEITTSLLTNNAIHYTDLLSIIKKAANLIPGVSVDLKREYGDKRLDIVIKSGKMTSTYTLMSTIVEYGTPKLSNKI